MVNDAMSEQVTVSTTTARATGSMIAHETHTDAATVTNATRALSMLRTMTPVRIIASGSTMRSILASAWQTHRLGVSQWGKADRHSFRLGALDQRRHPDDTAVLNGQRHLLVGVVEELLQVDKPENQMRNRSTKACIE